MTICTWTGQDVILTEARLIPVWVIKRPGRIDRAYRKPSKCQRAPLSRKCLAGTTAASMPATTIRCATASGLTPSIYAPMTLGRNSGELDELCPDGKAKYQEWNKIGAPEASHFWPPISEKEVA